MGLPLGALLCFRWRMGAVGMWAGLCLALVIIGSSLVLVWSRQMRELLRSSGAKESEISVPAG
jgi:MATE family multidrug resistance protein